jgi:Heparinase II/III-like protein/Heparinase II/III N-terminus
VINKLRAWLRRARTTPAVDHEPAPPPPPSLTEELMASHLQFDAWLQARPVSGGLYSSLPDDVIAGLSTRYPEQASATVRAADRVVRHEFDLLGSGPFVPIDPGRPARGGYRPIDWYGDPVKGLRFPERVPYRQWNLLEMRPGLADVKFPWDLSRCQHWMPLAQAFRLTRERAYAAEILNQHDDFMEANPVGYGVNWTCTMDVALRAFNWAMAADLLQASRALEARELAGLYDSLFAHGHFIERNLENKYEVTSNHFLSNVVGLFGVAMLFRDLPSGHRWLTRAREWLEQEIKVQVLPDGADYESSVPYHRLVAELFLSGARQARHGGNPLSPAYESRLRDMMAFLNAILRPDGRVPQVGDADDGRVHMFSDHGRWEPQDARHLLAPASLMFQAPEWWRADDPWAGWEGAWWGLPSSAAMAVAVPAEDQRQLFPDAGLVVDKTARHYLLITNGKVGTNGFGNHKHNDLLSFEFHDQGRPLIVDPGSYVYTSDPDARNYFRSTLAHNTVAIDGEEQNEFKAEWLFRMFEKALPEHRSYAAAGDVTEYRGRHDGYTRLKQPVIHERAFRFEAGTGTLTIEDVFAGEGTHRLQWRFHCAPGVTVTAERHLVTLSDSARRWQLRAADDLGAALVDDWYSPSYGRRLPSTTVAFEGCFDLATRTSWTFVLERMA